MTNRIERIKKWLDDRYYNDSYTPTLDDVYILCRALEKVIWSDDMMDLSKRCSESLNIKDNPTCCYCCALAFAPALQR